MTPGPHRQRSGNGSSPAHRAAQVEGIQTIRVFRIPVEPQAGRRVQRHGMLDETVDGGEAAVVGDEHLAALGVLIEEKIPFRTLQFNGVAAA